MKRFLTLFAALALTACVGGNYKTPDRTMLMDDGNAQLVSEAKAFESGIIKAFPDIPIPASHRVDLDRSVIFNSPTQTMGKIVLVGGGDPDSLFRFFEEQMVAQGWNAVNSFQSSTSSLYFAKPGKFTAIIIESEPRGGSRVFINVGPE